jgi:ATP-dependent Clp protease ATP-binding subunit ClpC
MDLTERAWHVIRDARDEALRLGDEHIGTDHLLLAMLREPGGAAADVLSEYGVDHSSVYHWLTAPAGSPAPTASRSAQR